VSATVTAALALAGVLLLVFAVTSPGYPVRHIALHDGGIWVTNNSAGLFGRLDKPIRQLDGGFAPAGGAQSIYHVDVLQHDNWERLRSPRWIRRVAACGQPGWTETVSGSPSSVGFGANGYYGSASCFESTNDPGAVVWIVLHAPNGARFESDHRPWGNAP
jgi:hypothetical protein